MKFCQCLKDFTFNMSPILQTNAPGTGGADIHSPERFLTFNQLIKLNYGGRFFFLFWSGIEDVEYR